MAKKSSIEKNLKRMKLVKKYEKKRAELKKIINNKKLELAQRFEAQLKLNKLPKNSSKIRIVSLSITDFEKFKAQLVEEYKSAS